MASLHKDISVQELLHMREEGMTNMDIAKSLDVSYATIYRMIGSQPKELRKQREDDGDAVVVSRRRVMVSYKNPNVVQSVQDEAEEEPEACLVVGDRIIRAGGTFATYDISTSESSIDISGKLSLKFDELDTFISELTAIKRQLPALKSSNEMW